MLVTVRNNVAALKQQGKSLDEIIAAKPTAAFDARWGNFVFNGDQFTKMVYAGLQSLMKPCPWKISGSEPPSQTLNGEVSANM